MREIISSSVMRNYRAMMTEVFNKGNVMSASPCGSSFTTKLHEFQNYMTKISATSTTYEVYCSRSNLKQIQSGMEHGEERWSCKSGLPSNIEDCTQKGRKRRGGGEEISIKQKTCVRYSSIDFNDEDDKKINCLNVRSKNC